MHTVAVLALDGVLAFDLATPIEVFGRTYLPGGQTAYRVQICAPTRLALITAVAPPDCPITRFLRALADIAPLLSYLVGQHNILN